MQTEISKVTREEIEAQTVVLQKAINLLSIKGMDDVQSAKELEKQCTSLEKLIEAERDKIVRPMNEAVKTINSSAKELVAPITQAKEDIRNKQIEYAQQLEAERLAKEREVLGIIQKINSTPDEVELELLADTIKHPDVRIKVAIETRRSMFEEQERQRKFAEEQRKEQLRLNEIAKQQWAEAARLEKIAAEDRLRKKAIEDEKNRILEDNRIKEQEQLAEYQSQEKLKKEESQKVKGMRKVLKFEVTDLGKVPREYMSPDESKIRDSLKEWIREIPGIRIWAEDKIQ